MLDCSRLRPFLVPAAGLTAALFCVAVPSARAQKVIPPQVKEAKTKEKANEPHTVDADLVKAIGKADAELFDGVMHQFEYGKTPLHLITETTAKVEQQGISVTISGRTEMRGNYGGAFASDHVLSFQQGEQSNSQKTQFVSDGKTFWMYRPDAKQYQEKSLAASKATLGDLIMGSSFDIVASIGARGSSDNKKDKETHMDSARVETGAFKGVPCRVLTVVVKNNDKTKTDGEGTMKVYLGANKRLRAVQFSVTQNGMPLLFTETFKVMETLPAAPDASTFRFTPPEGVTKVETIAD